MKRSWIKFMKYSLATAALAGMVSLSACDINVNSGKSANVTDVITDSVIAGMPMDEKISQMIIPAFRTWNEENVTDLSEFPELKEALKKHQYGGIILFGPNISGTEQVTTWILGNVTMKSSS